MFGSTIGGQDGWSGRRLLLSESKIGPSRLLALRLSLRALNYVAQEKLDHPLQLVLRMSIGGNPYPAIDTAAQADGRHS